MKTETGTRVSCHLSDGRLCSQLCPAGNHVKQFLLHSVPWPPTITHAVLCHLPSSPGVRFPLSRHIFSYVQRWSLEKISSLQPHVSPFTAPHLHIGLEAHKHARARYCVGPQFASPICSASFCTVTLEKGPKL